VSSAAVIVVEAAWAAPAAPSTLTAAARARTAANLCRIRQPSRFARRTFWQPEQPFLGLL
jgi:hypothetical protein